MLATVQRTHGASPDISCTRRPRTSPRMRPKKIFVCRGRGRRPARGRGSERSAIRGTLTNRYARVSQLLLSGEEKMRSKVLGLALALAATAGSVAAQQTINF